MENILIFVFSFANIDMTNSPPPNYYSSSNSYYHANNSQPALNYHSSVQQLQCPYYQLYGPPPSYDSVVQITNSCSSVQPTCVLVTTNTVPCSFATPSTANASIPLNEASSNTPMNSTIDAESTSTSAITQPNDFEQPSTSSSITNNAPSIERIESRRKSGSSSV